MSNRSHDRSRQQMHNDDQRFQRMPSQEFGGYRDHDLGRGNGRSEQMDQSFAGHQQYGDQGRERWGSSNQGYGNQGMGQSPWNRDAQSMGSSRTWRAPKGYTRSDERIREEICDRIGMEFDCSDVEVKVTDGEVSLTGTVKDRREKYHMEELIDGLGGVKAVHNLVQVKRESAQSDETSDRSSSSNTRMNEDNGRSRRPTQNAQH